MRPLVLFGWLVCVAAAARPSMPAAPVVPQADYASAYAAATALPQMHGLLVSHRGQLLLTPRQMITFGELWLNRGRQLFDLLETHVLPPAGG